MEDPIAEIDTHLWPHTKRGLKAVLRAIVLAIAVEEDAKSNLYIRVDVALTKLLLRKSKERLRHGLVRVPRGVGERLPGVFQYGVSRICRMQPPK